METIKLMRIFIAAATVLLVGACHETPQNAVKSFAGKEETQLYHDSSFKGDKVRFEKALAARAQKQNEYVRMGDAKAP